MQRFFTIFFVLAIVLCGMTVPAFGQIYGPEGLNMPGSYDSFTNPPTLTAFGGIEVIGGTLLLDNSLATGRYKTLIHVAGAGDITTGTYTFKFSSGPTGSPWNNSWGDGGTISANTVTHLNIGGGTANNTFTFNDATYYTAVWADSGYNGTSIALLATSAVPVTLPTVAQVPAAAHVGTGAVTVKVTASSAPAPEEIVYVRYSADGWVTSNLALASFVGANGTATIPGQVAGTTVSYYVFSTTVSLPSSNYDIVTLNSNTNSKTNYSYTTEAHLFVATTTSNWSTETWSPVGPPGSTDTVVVPDGVTLTVNANETVASIIVGGGTSGLLNFDDVAATPRKLVLSNDLDISAGGQVLARITNVAWDTLYLGGNLNNNGTFNAIRTSGSTNTIGLAVMFTLTTGDQYIQTTGSPVLTQFGKVYLSKGSRSNIVHNYLNTNIGNPAGSSHSSRPATLFILGSTGTATGYGTYEQDANTLNFVTSTVQPGASVVSAAANALTGFNIMGSGSVLDTVSGSFYWPLLSNINTTGTITLNSTGGTFGFVDTANIYNGTFYIYEATVGFPYWFSAPAPTNNPVVNFHGGHIYSSPYSTYATNGSGNSAMKLLNTATLNMDGGTFTFIAPEPSLTSGHDVHIALQATLNITGGQIQFGDGVNTQTSPTGFVISDSGTGSLNNLVIQGGGWGRQVALAKSFTTNSPTIVSGSILNDSTKVLTVTGNISNNGSIVDNTGAEIKLSGGVSSHTLSGNGSYTNLELSDANNASVSGNASVLGNLTLTTGTLSIGSGTLTLQNPILGTPGNLSGGSTSNLVFNGSASGLNIPGSVTSLNNFTLNNASGSTLQGQLAINGVLTVSNGVLTTGTADTITLSSTGSLSEAGNGKIVLGNVQTTRNVSGNAPLALKGKTPKSTLADQTFGNIGFEIDPAGGTTPGQTTVKRTTGFSEPPFNNNLLRYYDVNAATSTGLGATVVFHFDSSAAELNTSNGGSRTGLGLWTSIDGGNSWLSIGGTVDSVHGTITQTGVTHLSRWTGSAFPMVSTNSQNSDIVAGSLSIPATISSYATTQGTEVSVFSFNIRDGGGSPDADAVATIVNSLTIEQGAGNTAANWTQYIQGADLYNGPTNVGSATVGSNTLTFSGSPLASAPDDGNVELTLKIYLKTSLPVGADNKVLEFKINQNTDVVASGSSSLFAFGGSDVVGLSGTSVNVVAGKLKFVGTVGTQSSGVVFAPSVSATDTNGNVDADYVANVTAGIASGSGVVSVTNPKAAVAGTATFSDLSVAGHGPVSLNASSGVLIGATSNTFNVDSAATFKVANVADNILNWDADTSWVVVSGYRTSNIPTAQDNVVLDNTFHSGTYTVKIGLAKTDSASTITIGYPHNPNKITLLIPNISTSQPNPALFYGDGLAGTYDLLIDSNGVFQNSDGRPSGNDLFYNGSLDSIRIKKGGLYLHNTLCYQSYLARLTSALDGDYGTVEFDTPPFASGAFDINFNNYWFPNLTLSNTHGAGQYFNFAGTTGGAMFVKGNFTINAGVNDSIGLGGEAIVVYGNVINNGTTKITATLVAGGTTAQSISGGQPITLVGGLVSLNAAGVNVSTDLNMTAGTVQTTGTYAYNYIGSPVSPLPVVGVVSTGSNTMYLNPAGLLNEGNNPVIGNVSATRTASMSVDQAFGNIGFDINAAGGAPGVTTINRKTGTAIVGFGGSQSILEYFDVTAANNSALNAVIGFSYAPSELNSIVENTLLLNFSTNGGTSWGGKNGSVNTSIHKITPLTSLGAVNARWTATANSAPLFQPHTITVRKYQDVDGNLFTLGDESLRKWRLSLYQDSVAGTPVNTQNLNAGVMTTQFLQAGTYIATEADSTASGWVTLGKVHHGVRQVSSAQYDTLTVAGGIGDSTDFINEQVSSVTVVKLKTTDGIAADATAKKWHLSLYSGSVSPANLVTSADTSLLFALNVNPGTYIAVESDSGASWVRLNGNNTRFDTLAVAAASAVVDTFVNFQPNSIVVHKLEDNDGNFATSADRVAKAWHLVVYKDSLGGAVYATSDSGAIVLNSVGDGTYVITEADSAGWIHLGYTVNATPTASPVTALTESLVGGQQTVITFVNAPPVYSKQFRSFDQFNLSTDVDNKGKIGKPVARKAVADDFSFTLTAPAAVSVTAKFSMFSTGVVLHGTDTVGSWANAKAVTTSAIDTTGGHKTITFVGRGTTGKPVKTTYIWATLPKATKSATVATYAYNIPRLPMPNRVNGLMESYAKVYATTGLLIGKDYTSFADSAKIYGWLLTKKYTDVLKTLSNGGQTGVANRGFDIFISTKPLVKKQTSLPATKYNNILLADLLALKVNIAMSGVGITPLGFGELVYNDGGSNTLDGKMLREISAYADSVIMGWQVDSSYVKGTKTIHIAVHHFADPTVFINLDSIVHKVNAAFEGSLDTNYFADSLVYKGTRMLEGITFLQANPNVIPARIVPGITGPVNELPLAYKLEQNYPNPFNPTTTIQFSLTNPSIVTLKIYNILGQEVATLLNREQVSDGVQNLTWNANNLASGVYFYRLNVEGTTTNDDGSVTGTGKTSFQQVKKMLLVK